MIYGEKRVRDYKEEGEEGAVRKKRGSHSRRGVQKKRIKGLLSQKDEKKGEKKHCPSKEKKLWRGTDVRAPCKTLLFR